MEIAAGACSWRSGRAPAAGDRGGAFADSVAWGSSWTVGVGHHGVWWLPAALGCIGIVVSRGCPGCRRWVRSRYSVALNPFFLLNHGAFCCVFIRFYLDSIPDCRALSTNRPRTQPACSTGFSLAPTTIEEERHCNILDLLQALLWAAHTGVGLHGDQPCRQFLFLLSVFVAGEDNSPARSPLCRVSHHQHLHLAKPASIESMNSHASWYRILAQI
jgi:hypothetical protein